MPLPTAIFRFSLTLCPPHPRPLERPLRGLRLVLFLSVSIVGSPSSLPEHFTSLMVPPLDPVFLCHFFFYNVALVLSFPVLKIFKTWSCLQKNSTVVAIQANSVHSSVLLILYSIFCFIEPTLKIQET